MLERYFDELEGVSMRSIGFIVIVIGIVISIIAWHYDPGLVNDEEDVSNMRNANNLRWISLILAFSGIGFILYDVAAKGSERGTSKLRERFKGEQSAVMVCPHCNQKFRFGKSLIGSIGECPHCEKEVELLETPPPPPLE